MTEQFRPSLLRAQAREVLAGKWAISAVVSFVVLVLFGGISLVFPSSLVWFGSLAGFLLLPLAFGAMFIFLDLLREGTQPSVSALFTPFQQYGRYLGAGLLVYIYIILWTLLLIIPGIIKGYSYSMTFFILKDNPEMSVGDAISKSQRMMAGHKMEFFLLQLSFFGWLILASVTVVGLFWLMPYMYTAEAAFYVKLKDSCDCGCEQTACGA